MAIPVASIVLLWQALFHCGRLVNAVLSALGAQPVDFMGTDAAFWVLIGTYVWKKNAGYDMILWMAGWTVSPTACMRPPAWTVRGHGSAFGVSRCPGCCPRCS